MAFNAGSSDRVDVSARTLASPGPGAAGGPWPAAVLRPGGCLTAVRTNHQGANRNGSGSDTWRWHRRIHRDDQVDVWLIGWLPTQSTRLHDHGGSSGAFTVLSGELSEAAYVGTGPQAGTLRERVHGEDAYVAFGSSYVHDVRNLSDAPAVSVHAYSPPLSLMKFYAVRDGRLAIVGALETDDPEPIVPRSLVR